MIDVEKRTEYLVLRDSEDNNSSTTISFYMCNFNSGARIGFISAYNNTIQPIEDLFDVIPEPYRTGLLFNFDLIEEITQEIMRRPRSPTIF